MVGAYPSIIASPSNSEIVQLSLSGLRPLPPSAHNRSVPSECSFTRIHPIPCSHSSVMSVNGDAKSGKANIGAVTRAFFKVTNAF